MKFEWIFRLTLLLLGINYDLGNAQSTIVCGTVSDRSSGEVLTGVHIIMDNGTSVLATSNNEGRFCFHADTVGKPVRFTRIGYEDEVMTIPALNAGNLSVMMSEVEYLLPELQVSHTGPMAAHELSIVRLSGTDVKDQPMLLGEADPIKALIAFPGISSGREGSAGLHVRGGTPDQNLYLLDDVPLYNTDHLLGYMSTINPAALKSVSLFKGGIPARFGTRISSIVDMTTLEGSRYEKRGSYNIGLLSNALHFEGPISKGESSYFVGSRIANLSVLTWPLSILFNAGKIPNFVTYNMYDLNTKFTFALPKERKLSLSVYTGQDRIPEWYRDNDRGSNEEVTKRTRHYGHFSAATKYTGCRRSGHFFKSVLYFTNFRNVDRYTSSIDKAPLRSGIDKSILQEVGLKHREEYLFKDVIVSAGIDLGLFNVRPNNVQIEDFGAGTNLITRHASLTHILMLMPYGSASFRHNQMSFSLGLRTSAYFRSGNSEIKLEPRLSISYESQNSFIMDWSISRLSQPLHLLSSYVIGLPNYLWVGSDARAPVSSSTNLSLDLGRTFGVKRSWTMKAGFYYRRLENLIDYRQGVRFTFDAQQDYIDKIVTHGKGQTYGLEVFLETKQKAFDASLSVTVARSDRKYHAFNSGSWFRSRYDRLVSIDFLSKFRLTRHFHLGSYFTFSTGHPITLAEGYALGLVRGIQPYFPERLNAESPNYWRWDLQLRRDYESRKLKKVFWSVGVYNLLLHFNPVKIELDGGYRRVDFGDIEYTYIPQVRKVGAAFFRFVPNFSFGKKF